MTGGYAVSHSTWKTMRLINQARDEHGATVPVTLADLPDMRAVFATNAVVGIRPVSAIDGIQWSAEHPVLDILRKQYADIPPELLWTETTRSR